MNVEKVISDGKEIIIIDDMLTYGAIDYFYILIEFDCNLI